MGGGDAGEGGEGLRQWPSLVRRRAQPLWACEESNVTLLSVGGGGWLGWEFGALQRVARAARGALRVTHTSPPLPHHDEDLEVSYT